MPPQSFNWADDEDDNFDLAAWKVKTDISAPKTEDLGPFLPIDVEETYTKDLEVILDGEPIVYDISLTPTFESFSFHSAFNHLPAAPSALLSPNPKLWNSPAPSAVWVRMNENDQSGAPAYPELSRYEDGTVAWGRRESYAATWRSTRVRCGSEWKEGIVWRGSGLRREVKHCDEMEWEGVTNEKSEEEVTTLGELNDEAEKDQVTTPGDSSSTCSEDDSVKNTVEASTPSSDLGATVTNSVLKTIIKIEATELDAEFSHNSPTETKISKLNYKVSAATPSETRVMELEFRSAPGVAITDTEYEEHSKRKFTIPTSEIRVDPTETLSSGDRRPQYTEGITETNMYVPGPHICILTITSPDVKYTTPGSNFGTFLSGVLTAGRLFFWCVPWKALIIAATGAIADIAVHLARH